MSVKRDVVLTCLLALGAPAWADLPNEMVSTVPAISAKHRIYVADIAINHISDGKLHVVDGDNGNYLGMIGTGFTGQFILSNNKREIIVATGYYSRGQRGDRADIVEVWDADTLTIKYEIPIALIFRRALAICAKCHTGDIGQRDRYAGKSASWRNIHARLLGYLSGTVQS
jgi:Methylamine dehydrogenase heavy chain (MADH)